MSLNHNGMDKTFMCLELKDKIYVVFKSEETSMKRRSVQLDHSIAKFPKKSRGK